MDRQLEEFLKEYQYFKREWTEFYRNFNTLRIELAELRRELGVREGRLLSQQMDEVDKIALRNEEELTHVRRDVVAIRKLLEYNEVNIKEVMKALSLIYRNVDELEDGLLPNSNT